MSSPIREKFSFTSSNGLNTINGFIIRPENPPYKAIIQISHGMIEHSERYVEFMTFMAQHGYVTVAHDHLGHKGSVDDDTQLGYMAKENGYIYVLSDLVSTAAMARKRFPQLKLFLLGQSMGSFFARCFAAKYKNLIDGVIITGTGGTNKNTPYGKALLKVLIKLKGGKATSKLATGLLFKHFLDKIDQPQTKSDWLSRDREQVEKYRNDPYCRFHFTVSGYLDLLNIQEKANSEECYKNTKKDIPYLILSGDMDPVGDWGNGVKEVYNKYKQCGIEDVILKLYPEGRHEMLNELNKDEVYDYILNWTESKI